MSSASSLTIVRFVPAHFELLDLQPSQAYVREHTDHAKLIELEQSGVSISIFAGERLVCCGGVREYGADRGVLWSFVDRRAGSHFTALHRVALRFIEVVDRPHLQATCRTGFEAGARWLRMMDFTWSRALGEYGPARIPHDLFERVH